MGETLKFACPTHSEQLCEGIIELLKTNFQTDFKLLVRSEKRNERQVVKVHHLILSIFCPVLRNVTEKKFNLDSSCNIDDLKSLVEFMYTGKTTINQERLFIVRNSARSIGLLSLVHSINTFLKSKQNEIESVNPTEQKPHHSQDVAQDQNNSTTTASSTSQLPISHDNYAAIQNSKSAQKKIACKYCNFRVKHRWQLTSHMACRHHLDSDGNLLEKNVTCPDCSYTCYSPNQLKQHRHMKHSKVLIKCEQCPYVCPTNAIFRQHMRTAHSEERPIMCELCGRRFKMMGPYKEHLRRHQGERVGCEICSKVVTVGSLKRHMELHESDEKPFACHVCSFATRKRANLRIHLKNVHRVHMDKQGNICGPTDDDPVHTLSTEDNAPTDNEIDDVELP